MPAAAAYVAPATLVLEGEEPGLDWMTEAIERGRRERLERAIRSHEIAMREQEAAGCPACASRNVIGTDRSGSGSWRCITCGYRFSDFGVRSAFEARDDEHAAAAALSSQSEEQSRAAVARAEAAQAALES